jgi:hypothetical protein
MAKRQKTLTKSSLKQEPATPEKPKPEGKSELSVNPDYDQMPDRIEDPLAVLRLAYLDMKRVAAHNKMAYVTKDQHDKVAAAVREQNAQVSACTAELREVDREIKAQQDAIEAQYGIALRAYTYNDETGVLTKQALLAEEPKPKAEE